MDWPIKQHIQLIMIMKTMQAEPPKGGVEGVS